MILKLSSQPNPVGVVKDIPEIKSQISDFKQIWDEDVANSSKAPWWKPWSNPITMHKASNFLISCLDELINIVDNLVDSGPDKKATVLAAVAILYDYVVKEALPIWLKPFAGKVRSYIIYTLMSIAIDWIVDKYRNGSWRSKIPQPEVG